MNFKVDYPYNRNLGKDYVDANSYNAIAFY